MCMTKDAVNLLQRRIETMAGGFISGRSIPPNTKTESIQGRGCPCKLGEHDVGIRRPNNADIRPAAWLDFDLGSKILPSQMINSRKITHKEPRDEPRIVDHLLNDVPRTDDGSILDGLNDTVVQERGCGGATGKLNKLLHSPPESWRPLLQYLSEVKCTV